MTLVRYILDVIIIVAILALARLGFLILMKASSPLMQKRPFDRRQVPGQLDPTLEELRRDTEQAELQWKLADADTENLAWHAWQVKQEQLRLYVQSTGTAPVKPREKTQARSVESKAQKEEVDVSA